MAKSKKENNTDNYITVDYVDEMRQSYIDYAMSVITMRALPDVRDGLKPVHRRILYAMLLLGLIPEKNYRKCARIVGDTLGKYHPHGDTSVYDALVRMAQDFKMGATLVDGHGNFGSVDGDSAAAMRYCLTGDTLISTNNGLLKIKDIIKDSELSSEYDIDLLVKSLGHKTNKVVKFFNSGIHPVKEVITELGYSIKGSYNHPVLTLTVDEGGKPIFYWKTIDNIKEGDYLVIDRNIGMVSSPKDYVSENEAKLLGGLLSYGYISPQYKKVCFTNSNFNFVDDMEIWFKELFKDENVIRCERKDGCSDVYITTDKVNEIKEKYNYGDYFEHKTVPNLILKSSLEIQSLFIRYLFEGNGSVKHKVRKRLSKGHEKASPRISAYITYISKSLMFTKQLQTMLLQFGIYSDIHSEREYYRLVISGKSNIRLFYENIGFAYEKKQQMLKDVYDFSLTEDMFESDGKDNIPYLREYVLSRSKSTLSKYNFSNMYKFKKNKEIVKTMVDIESLNLIEYFHSLNYLYVPVSQIKDIGEDVVYSVKVDSECHSFIANGIVNHNTEAKLTEIATYLLKDLDKDVIDFMDNFDGTEKEPVVLPAKYPNLLVNGSKGIAVGMATNIPPHNIGEVIDATIAFIDNNKITVEKLLEYLNGPDYPTGGIIINKDKMNDFYKTGNSTVIIRSKIEIENGSYGRTNVIVTDIPYKSSGNKTKLINSIIELVNDKILDEIVDVRDESSNEGTRIILEVKKGVNIDNLLNKLYDKTKLQDKDTYNFLVLDNKEPKVINLTEYMQYYVDFQKELMKRKYSYLLRKAEDRKEILEGLSKAVDVMDEIIEVFRGSKDVKMVKECLMLGKTDEIKWKTKKSQKVAKSFDFTERQAIAILDMKLQKLITLEIEKLKSDYEEVKMLVSEYTEIINSDKKQLSLIKRYLKDLKKEFNIPRKTEIINAEIEEYKETFIEEELYVLIDKFGYIKTVDTNSVSRSSDDVLNEFKYKFLTMNTDKVAIFTNNGNIHQIKLTDIPKGKMKDKGVPVETLCKMKKNEYAITVLGSASMQDKQCVLITKLGLIKKSDCNDFETNRVTISSTKLDDIDEVIDVKILEPGYEMLSNEVAVVTKEGMAIRFSLNEVPLMKKNSKGVKSIITNFEEDWVEQIHLIPKKTSVFIKIKDKKVDISTLRKKSRGKKGSKL